MDFDFDGVVRLRLDDAISRSIAKEFNVWECGSGTPDLAVERGRVGKEGMRVTSEYYAGDGFYTILFQGGVYRVEKDRILCDGTTSEDFLAGEVVQPRLNQCFVEEGRCFIHASGVSIEGKAVLFPAMGGVGKTNLMLELLSRGARFIGDDYVIVGKDGRFISYPRWVNVLDYNLAMFPELFERVVPDRTVRRQQERRLWLYRKSRDIRYNDPISQMIKARTMAWFYFSRRVRPDTLFPTAALEKSGEISNVFYLRQEGNGAAVVGSSPARVARLSAASAFPTETDFLHRMCSEISGLDYAPMEQLRSVCANAYDGAECFEVSVGESLTRSQLGRLADEIESRVAR